MPTRGQGQHAGKGPRPTAETNTSARISSLMLRITLRNWRVMRRSPVPAVQIAGSNERQRQGQNHAQQRAPDGDLYRLQRRRPQAWQHAQSGGTERERKSPICGMPPASSLQLICAPAALSAAPSRWPRPLRHSPTSRQCFRAARRPLPTIGLFQALAVHCRPPAAVAGDIAPGSQLPTAVLLRCSAARPALGHVRRAEARRCRWR